MTDKLKQIFENIVPFLVLGVAIALLVGIFIMFSYVLFWGLIIGLVLWIVSTIKNLLFPRKELTNSSEESKGRIIEHDED